MWQHLAVLASLAWMIEGVNETSCLLQFRPRQGVLSAGKRFKGCSSSSRWREQLSVTPLPAAPLRGVLRGFADAAGEFGLLAWSQTGNLDQVLVYQNPGSRYYKGSSGWESSANLTEIAAQNVSLTEGWAKSEVAISSANLVVAAKVRSNPDQAFLHTFRFDGASWNFLGMEDIFGVRELHLGGNRIVVVRGLNGKNRFKTFELPASGTGWSELTSAYFEFPSRATPMFAMDDQTSLVARRYVTQVGGPGGPSLSTADIYEWNGTSAEWLGPVASVADPYNSTVSNFIYALAIDDNYLIVAWATRAFPRTEYVVTIHERQDGSWPEAFRTVLDFNESGFVDVSISNSGRAAVTAGPRSNDPNNLDGTLRIFEKSSSGWDLALMPDVSIDIYAGVHISKKAALLAGFDRLEQSGDRNTEALGYIYSCNKTAHYYAPPSYNETLCRPCLGPPPRRLKRRLAFRKFCRRCRYSRFKTSQ